MERYLGEVGIEMAKFTDSTREAVIAGDVEPNADPWSQAPATGRRRPSRFGKNRR